jgi:HAMP domain-containing protein/HD superfamily phosphohydrolase YqeK
VFFILVGVNSNIKLTKFSKIISNLKFANNGTLMLSDDSGYIFAHRNNDMISKNLMDEKWSEQIFNQRLGTYIENVDGIDLLISFIQVDNVDWKLVAISPLDFKSHLMLIRNEGLRVASGVLIIVLILGYLLSIMLTEPIENIMATIEDISNGDMSARTDTNSNDEFEIMGNELNNMLDKIKELLEERGDYVLEIEKNYISTVAALANAIEVNDSYTGGHCNRVRDIAKEISVKMDLNEQQLKNLEFACLLHDIGKLGIPSSILTKETSLTKEEFDKIKRHPEMGYIILKGIDFLTQARDIIIQHHERIDGKGYPYGIKGEEIGLLAKILSVADAYDAMTSSRYYRKIPLTHIEAMEQLETCKGTQFDIDVVEFFKELRYEEKPKEIDLDKIVN